MDEETMEASLVEYREQTTQMDAAIAVTTDTNTREELVKLRDEIQNLITLTEESLLSLKKSKLLSIVENSLPTSAAGKKEAEESTSSEFDAEFAAFQASLAGDATVTNNTTTDSSTDSTSCDTQLLSEELSEDLEALVGAKCRVPHSHDWGPVSWQNAMVFCAEPIKSEGELQVRVLFCNPTHRTMVPCPYFLDNKCNFTDEDCKFSHGYVVSVSEIREFEDPDHSLLLLGASCLAKFRDGVWYGGKVVDVHDNGSYTVMFDAYDDETLQVEGEDIIPAGEEDSQSAESEDEGSEPASVSDSDNEGNALPVFLWRPQTTDRMGEWEQYTRGIGSKLMQKMGYIIGHGLGKDGRGRAEPVPIQLLPQGKSLDKIMELKELAGDRDLYDVLKKKQKKQQKVEKTAAKKYVAKTAAERVNVFDFINKKLKGKKGDIHQLTKGLRQSKKQQRSEITEKDLHSRSDKHLNVQLLKTDEEIRNVEREISKLKSTVTRNSESKAVVKKVNEKIISLEKYLEQLKSSSNSISKHKQKRKDQKKLTIF